MNKKKKGDKCNKDGTRLGTNDFLYLMVGKEDGTETKPKWGGKHKQDLGEKKGGWGTLS